MPNEQEMMGMMGGAAGGAPAPGGAPVSAPMATPQANEGQQQEAMILISMAQDLLEQALGPFGSETEKGRSLMTALSALSKSFGEKRQKAGEMQGAEIRQLMQSLPSAGGASPEMKSMMGGAPGGAPAPQAMAA